VITHELNVDELSHLLMDTIYDDSTSIDRADLDGRYITVISPALMCYAYVWTTQSQVVAITQDRHERLLREADKRGAYMPLIVVGTPEGVYEFNMDIQKVEFEPHSNGDEPDVMVAELPISKGKHILPFYPEFSSEDEYFDSLMGDAEPGAYDESDTW